MKPEVRNGLVVLGICGFCIWCFCADSSATEERHRQRWANAIAIEATVIERHAEERRRYSRRRSRGTYTAWINTVEFDGGQGTIFGDRYFVGQKVRLRYLPSDEPGHHYRVPFDLTTESDWERMMK